MPLTRRVRLWVLLAISVLLVALYGGCGRQEEPGPPGLPAPGTVFAFVIPSEPETFDPALMSDPSNFTLLSALFEGLTAFDPRDASPVPGVAARWEISPDGLTYTFHLRRAMWSNSQPILATDFLYAWRRILDAATGSPFAALLYPVANARGYHLGEMSDFSEVGLSAPDESTLIVRLEHPAPYFLHVLAYPALAPVPPERLAAHGPRWALPQNLICNGAFIIEQHVPGVAIQLRRNSAYWDSRSVKLLYATAVVEHDLRHSFVPYLNGDADWITSIMPHQAGLVSDRADFHTTPLLGTFFLCFNTDASPVDDPFVRKALNLAIDKRDICENILLAGQQPAATLVPPSLPAYAPPAAIASDADAARLALADAGFPDGSNLPPIQILCNDHPVVLLIAEAIRRSWSDTLNVHAEVVALPYDAFGETLQRGEFIVATYSWLADFPDPVNFLELFSSESEHNFTSWHDENYDSLLAQARHAVGPASRMALLRQAEELLLERANVIAPVYHYAEAYLLAPRVENFFENVLNIHPLKAISVNPQAPPPPPPGPRLMPPQSPEGAPIEPENTEGERAPGT